MAQGEESPPWTSPFAETQSPHKTQTPLRPHLCHANISALGLFALPSTKQELSFLENIISGVTQEVTAENTPALDFGASAGMAERSSINVKETIKYENGI